MIRNKHKLSYERRRGLVGYVFLIPWIIGTLVFFIYPFLQSVVFSFSDVTFDNQKVITKFVGLNVYKAVFIEDPTVFRMMLSSVGQTLLYTVCVLIMSIFLAIILNQNFVGRSFWRLIFCLPIIVSSGLVLEVFKNDLTFQASTSDATTIFQSTVLSQLLLDMGIGDSIINVVVTAVNNIVDILWMSGVQILLFITGLQSVSPMLYEVCDVEGATAWQKFWNVTFPLLTPYIMLNVVYTIIDISTSTTNAVMKSISGYYRNVMYSRGSAESVGYFLMILAILAIVAAIMSKRTFYIDK